MSGKIINRRLVPALRALITVLLAFAAALCLRRSAGIIAMLPAGIALTFASAFIGQDIITRFSAFLVTVFVLNTVEEKDARIVALFMALCLLALVFSELGARALKKNRTRGIVLLSAGAAVCIAVSAVFIGNPVSAAKSQKLIRAELDRKYPSAVSEELGGLEASAVYYDVFSRIYAADITCGSEPTRPARMYTMGGAVYDSFESVAEECLARPVITRLSELLEGKLRSYDYSVGHAGLTKTSGGTIPCGGAESIAAATRLTVRISGVQTEEAFVSAAEEFITAIDGIGFPYESITFTETRSVWLPRTAVVSGRHSRLLYDIIPCRAARGRSTEFALFEELSFK